MISDDTRKRLENIVRGVILETEKDTCTAARNLLCASFRTSTTVKQDFEGQSIVKKEQEQLIRSHSDKNGWWVSDLPRQNQYLTRGGEAQIYLSEDRRNVIKLNDAIYYATWLEFLNSILIHNHLFPQTAYTLLGFTDKAGTLFAVIQQQFVTADAQADLSDIKKFLSSNGFENTRRNDYFNKELGIILEDMHDENILVNSNTLFFIDTVFYTISEPQT